MVCKHNLVKHLHSAFVPGPSLSMNLLILSLSQKQELTPPPYMWGVEGAYGAMAG